MVNIYLARRSRYIILIEEQLVNVIDDVWHMNT